MSESKAQLSRFAAVFAGGTLFSRVLGLVRDILLGAFIPVVSRDAFFFAFKLPNMLRDMLGEGATNAAFVPVFTESQEKDSEEGYRDLVSAALSAMLVVFAVLTLAGILLAPLIPSMLELLRPLLSRDAKGASELEMQLNQTVTLVQWTFPYLFFIGMAVFAMGPLFVARHYSTPAWSPALLNVALIAACLSLRDYFADPAWALVAGVWLGGLAQLAVMFTAMKSKTGILWPNFRLGHPGVRRICWLLAPVVIGQAAGEVNKLVDSFFAYALEDGTVTALFYANRLVQLPLSVFGIAVASAILPSISRAATKGNHEEIRATLLHGYRQTFFLIAPAIAGLLVLGRPIIGLLFEHGHFDAHTADRAATALFYYAFGLIAFAWVKISVQGFYAVQNTKLPVIVASASMVLNILLNCALVGPMGYRGLALSTTIAFSVNFLLLYALLWGRFGSLWDRTLLPTFARVLLATALMATGAYGVHYRAARAFGDDTLVGQGISLALALTVGGALYAGLNYALRTEELRQFAEALRKRRQGEKDR